MVFLNNNGEDDWGGIIVLFGGVGDDCIMNDFNGYFDCVVFYWMFGGLGDDLFVLYLMFIGELFGGSGNDWIFFSGEGGVVCGGGGDDLVLVVNFD